jgi:hypothetical protein
MLMSKEFAFIFIKAFKVGGTSTELFFQPACQPPKAQVTHAAEMQISQEGIVGARADFSARVPPRFFNHMTAAEIFSEIPRDDWEACRKIGNIRNPFSRYLSGFFFWAARAGVDLQSGPETKAAFVDHIKSGMGNYHFDFFRIDGKVCLDEIIRFETLEDDCMRVARNLSYTPPAPLAHMKKPDDVRSGRAIGDFYTKASASAVLEREAWYFERFGYSTNPEDA